MQVTYLFSSPEDPATPLRYEVAPSWLRKAEELAGVPKQNGTLWHAYRRKWATEPDTMLEVVLEGTALRDARS